MIQQAAITRMKLADIRPAPYNPRIDLRPGDPQYEALRKSLERWGLVETIVVNRRSGNLVGGHQRLKILQQSGVPEADVSLVDLGPDDEKALNIALNSPALAGEYDDGKLAGVLQELQAGGYEIGLTGFGPQDLDRLLADLATATDAADDEPPALQETAITRLGDVWILGRHRLLCGDGTAAADVARVLHGAQPALMVTDPPYGVSYTPSWRTAAAKKGLLAFASKREGKVANDNRADWGDAWKLFPGAVAYVWHADGYASLVADSLTASGFEIRCQIVWAKQHFVISRGHYHWQHEPCWYAVRPGQTANWIGDRSQTTLWKINNRLAKGGPGQEQDESSDHGTQKPVECMARPIRNHSGDVYDPFVGSGTTIIAAEQLGRTCYAVEIEPLYCDVAIRRWQTFTGQKARREDGASFPD